MNNDPSILKEKLENKEYSQTVKQPEVYKLDSSKQNPKESARLILEHFHLYDA